MIQEITSEFVESYKERLQANLTLHVKYDRVSLEKASEILNSLMTNVFGNEEHAGIAQFILHNDPSMSAEDAVVLAERHFDRGWRIRNEGGKYILFDEKYSKIGDLSGPTEYRNEETFELVEEEAHLFLEEADARKLGATAVKKGIPSRDMISPTKAYQLIEKYYGSSHDLYPVVQSYYALGKILRKENYFPGGKPGNTLRSIQEKGYKVDGTLNPTTLPQAYLSNGTQHILLRPITHYVEAEESYYKNRKSWNIFYKGLGIETDEPDIISDLGQVYAFAFQRKEIPQDIGEIVRILGNITEGVNHGRSERLLGLISVIMLTENVVRLHNFGLEGIHINTVKISPVVKYLPKASSRKSEEVLASIESASTASDLWSALKGISSDESSAEFRDAIGYFASKVPSTYKAALGKLGTEEANKLMEKL